MKCQKKYSAIKEFSLAPAFCGTRKLPFLPYRAPDHFAPSSRFTLRLYEIKLGTLEAEAAAETEWALRPYMNTARKRRFLSDDDGFEVE